MLELKDVSHQFGDSRLQYDDWSVEKGDHSMILGSSGSGKTTLLHLIGGLLKAQSGSIKIGGEELASKSQAELDRFRKEQIGIIFQSSHLIKALTVYENILLAQFLGGNQQKKEKVDAVLDQLGIRDLALRKVTEISQGQAQRVAIARAVVNEPALLLADEPTASLDDENCDAVVSLLKEQSKATNAQLIIITHDTRIKTQFKNHLEL